MDEYSIIYLEFDAKDMIVRSIFSYVWTTIPDLKHKDNMINVMLLKVDTLNQFQNHQYKICLLLYEVLIFKHKRNNLITSYFLSL